MTDTQRPEDVIREALDDWEAQLPEMDPDQPGDGVIQNARDALTSLTTRLEQWMKQAEDTEYHRLNAIRRAFDAESRLEQAEGAIARYVASVEAGQGEHYEGAYAELRAISTAEPSKYVLGDLHECGIRHYAVSAYLDCGAGEPTKGERCPACDNPIRVFGGVHCTDPWHTPPEGQSRWFSEAEMFSLTIRLEQAEGALQRLASPTRLFTGREWEWDEEHRVRLKYARAALSTTEPTKGERRRNPITRNPSDAFQPKRRHQETEPTKGERCQGCEDAPFGQHTGPHDWEPTKGEPK